VDEPDADGVELELEPEGVELLDEPEDGVALEPDALPLEDVSDELLGVLLLELEALGVLGVVLELLLELGELGVALEPLLDEELGGVLGVVVLELEDDGDDGVVVVLEDEDDGEVAPLPESGPRLQPYRPVTATAMGRTTKAVFLIKLMVGLL
jgi:hypothetical protein